MTYLHPREIILERITGYQREVAETHWKNGALTVSPQITPDGEVTYFHDINGLAPNDFTNFAHPDDPRALATLQRLRSETVKFAQTMGKLVVDDTGSERTVLIPRLTMGDYSDERKRDRNASRGGFPGLLDFILEHTAPLTDPDLPSDSAL